MIQVEQVADPTGRAAATKRPMWPSTKVNLTPHPRTGATAMRTVSPVKPRSGRTAIRGLQARSTIPATSPLGTDDPVISSSPDFLSSASCAKWFGHAWDCKSGI
jgi:hypothetical protein